MVLSVVVLHVSARERVDRGWGQRHIGPVGAVDFGGLGSTLGLLFLPSFATLGAGEAERERWRGSDETRRRSGANVIANAASLKALIQPQERKRPTYCVEHSAC